MVHNSYDNADPNAVFELAPDLRNCLKSDERNMDTFSKYSYVNCVAECRSAIVNFYCNCVPYNLPNNGTSKIRSNIYINSM